MHLHIRRHKCSGRSRRWHTRHHRLREELDWLCGRRKKNRSVLDQGSKLEHSTYIQQRQPRVDWGLPRKEEEEASWEEERPYEELAGDVEVLGTSVYIVFRYKATMQLEKYRINRVDNECVCE